MLVEISGVNSTSSSCLLGCVSFVWSIERMNGVQYMTPRRHPGSSQERDNPYCWTNSKDESENETKKLE